MSTPKTKEVIIMPNRYSNVKACPICGRKSWTSDVRVEPVDKTGLITYAKKKVEYRVCPCGHEEPVRTISQDNSII